MLIRLVGYWGILSLLLALLWTSPAGAQQAISEEAKLYFRNGVELLEQNPPNYQDAYHQFKRAYESSQSWKVLGNLGLCSLKLERDGEALDHYQKYLEQGGSEVDPEERSAIERDLLLVKGNLVQVDFSSDLPEVQLTDSRQGTSAPPQLYTVNGPTSLGLRAGTHTLIARAQGKELRWEVVLAPGQTVSHEFKFAEPVAVPAAAPASQAVAAPPAAESSSSGSTLRTVGFVSAGVGGAALIGGVVTALMKKKNEDDARKQCIGDVCAETAQDKFDKAEKFATMTNILLIGGGVLAATGVTLIVVGGSQSEGPSSARLSLSPAMGWGEGGLVAQGAF
ncbi:MAG TPA: hypothetical protein VHO25_02070 [Polyangiaceae bacterium]|nr:hypothetical protein [Polyangiaceae bacterium]